MDRLELDNSKLTTCALKLYRFIFSTLELDNSTYSALKLESSRFRNFDDFKAYNKN